VRKPHETLGDSGRPEFTYPEVVSSVGPRPLSRYDSLGIPGSVSEWLAFACWFAFVGFFVLLGGSLAYHALTGLDRKEERLAHSGLSADGTLLKCDHTRSGSVNRCLLRYTADDRFFTTAYPNRDGQFDAVAVGKDRVLVVVDPHHPATMFTNYDVNSRSKEWQTRIVEGALLIAFGLLILGVPIVFTYI
jgi:hypothetical protein